MKKLILILSAAFVSALMSCTTEYYDSPIPGPVGPQGPQGPAGVDGENAYIFEYTNVNFTSPDYEVILEYPSGFQGLDSDVALVYLLWDVQEVDGVPVEIWRSLPQQVFAPFGIIQYNYDFTKNDVRLFMEGTFSPNDLSSVDTNNWIVRVVVVPGDFWNGGRVGDITYAELMDALKIDYQNKHTTTQSRRETD